jgi:hypothetical protein
VPRVDDIPAAFTRLAQRTMSDGLLQPLARPA